MKRLQAECNPFSFFLPVAGAPTEQVYKKKPDCYPASLIAFIVGISYPEISGEFPHRNHPVPKGIYAALSRLSRLTIER
jgi:hypothetical protein